MATVAQTTVASKVFYAHLDDQSGVLGKVNGHLVFLADATLDIVNIGPEHINFLVVLGECGLADSQAATDKLRRGYAGVCTSRRMEVA